MHMLGDNILIFGDKHEANDCIAQRERKACNPLILILWIWLQIRVNQIMEYEIGNILECYSQYMTIYNTMYFRIIAHYRSWYIQKIAPYHLWCYVFWIISPLVIYTKKNMSIAIYENFRLIFVCAQSLLHCITLCNCMFSMQTSKLQWDSSWLEFFSNKTSLKLKKIIL